MNGSEYFRLIRFSHTLFALPFAMLAAVMSLAVQSRLPTCWEIVAFFGCMVTGRAAAMAFNRLVDKKWDTANPRTSNRSLPAGKLSPRAVAFFTVGCSAAFVGFCCLFLPNLYPVVFSVPVLCWLFGYSFAKRFTIVVHFWLGSALAMSPLATWIALYPVWHPAPILLAAVVLFWTAGFDILYSCQDADFDRKSKLFSVPARFGVSVSLRIAAVCHGVMLLLLAILPLVFPPFFPLFYGGVAVTAGLVVYQHWIVLPHKDCEEDVRIDHINVAFFHLNVIISVTLLITGIIATLC